jgi:hypothetical protein
MGDYGIKVMQIGKNITSNDPLDHVLSSKYSAVKIAQETLGTLFLSGTADASATISHDLGFSPMTLVYSELSTNNWFFGFPYTPTETAQITANPSKTYCGTSNVVLTYNKNSSGTVNIRYKVFIMGDSA